MVSTVLIVINRRDVTAKVTVTLPITTTNRILAIFTHAVAMIFRRTTSGTTRRTQFHALSVLRISTLNIRTLHITVPTLVISLFIDTSVIDGVLDTVPRFIAHKLRVTNNFVIIINCTVILHVVNIGCLVPFFFLNFLTNNCLSLDLLTFNNINIVVTLLCVRLGPR